MQIRQLKISNFRGIHSLDWKPDSSFCCLIGSGDTGKSTLLDAVEATLSSRWLYFTESDFIRGDTSEPIVIEASVGELSKALTSDERLGLYIRGWSDDGQLRDEPEDNDEPILTVRLTIDATMEPAWELVCNRYEEPRTLSNRDRALFGLVRLAGEDARHLTWGQGSVLAKLTGDESEAATRLADAYRAARDSAKLSEIQALAEAAQLAEGYAKGLGAYVGGAYEPGLELGRSGLSSGSIAIHDSGVPLRLAGLGTRRLATLAIQKSAIKEGAVVLIDEIEHGLEPHRILGAIAQLKGEQFRAKRSGNPVGQVLMTTHSDVAVGEVGANHLNVIRASRAGRITTVASPQMPEPIHALLRHTPRAMFARRILVAEGRTELGLLLGLRENWPARHDNRPIEQLGAALADGNGSEAPSLAAALAGLGYSTALYRDSDTPLTPGDSARLESTGVQVFEYGGSLNTEHAILSIASDSRVQEILDYARAERGDGAIDDNIRIKIPDLDLPTVQGNFSAWAGLTKLDGPSLRTAIAEVADRKRWFKDERIARGLAPIVWQIFLENPASPFALTLHKIETWLYA